MYKLLLCWRYLLTRYLALACVVSVMLGVATLIVVNSVMSGFSTKLKDRLHGLLSDVSVEAIDFDGFPDPEGKMRLIRMHPYLGERVEAMAPTLEIFAMLQYKVGETPLARTVKLIGIDPERRALLGGFKEHLTREENRVRPSFGLSPEAKERYLRRHRQFLDFQEPPRIEPLKPGEKPPPDPPPSKPDVVHGIIVGYAMAKFRDKNTGTDLTLLHHGDEVVVTTLSGVRLTPVYSRFVVCDYFKSEMSDYDANYVFVPLDYLQKLRTMEDRVTGIQIKLKADADINRVEEELKALFPNSTYQVQTWMDKQGPLLAAISIERGLLNVLLFLIIAVAGFGILAIFSMIVVEKTRDIGILKALGASNRGVMTIFLGYGLLLGLVGAALGTGLGLYLTFNLNGIEKKLTWLTGLEVFPKSVYYFDKIPTDVQPLTVLTVNLGAVLIAVVFSVLPALRAALLHPVRALRYE